MISFVHSNVNFCGLGLVKRDVDIVLLPLQDTLEPHTMCVMIVFQAPGAKNNSYQSSPSFTLNLTYP